MQPDIHPAYGLTQITCSCGNKFTVGSTIGDKLLIDVCNKCHPFYTGKKRETISGNIEKFNKRYQKISKPSEAA